MDAIPGLQALQNEMEVLASTSFQNEMLMDVQFSAEEVAAAVAKLKNQKAAVTLTSMVGKVLEFLLLERMQMVFLKENLPHVNQTAYQKSVSCAHAIFATQEVIA